MHVGCAPAIVLAATSLLGCGRATTRAVRLHLEHDVIVDAAGSRVVSRGEGTVFDEPIAPSFAVTLRAPDHATVRAELRTTVVEDRDHYWGDVIFESGWNLSIVDRRGRRIAGHTDLPAHAVLFASPLERLRASNGPFALPTNGEGVIVVAADARAIVQIDDRPPEPLAPASDVDGFGRGFSLPVIVPLAPGPHVVRASFGGADLTQSIVVRPGEYVYLCAKLVAPRGPHGSLYI